MSIAILEYKTRKRRSRRVKEHFVRLNPGENWLATTPEGQRVLIVAEGSNTGIIYVGVEK